jgi:hypothetical protein
MMWLVPSGNNKTNSGGSFSDPAFNDHPIQRELGSTGVDDRIVPDNAVPGFRPNIEKNEK